VRSILNCDNVAFSACLNSNHAHTRHKDVRTMRGYVRRAKLMQENPAKLLEL